MNSIKILLLALFLPGLAVVAFLGAWVFLMFSPLLVIVGVPFVGSYWVYKRTVTGRNVFKAASAGIQTVLIVDDDEASILPVRAAFERNGAKVAYVSSGRKMMRALARSTFNLIVLDSLMPGQSGEDALVKADQAVRNRPRTSVVFFTVNTKLRIPKGLNNFTVRGMWSKTDFIGWTDGVSRIMEAEYA